MRTIRFLVGTTVVAVVTFFFAAWARRETEAQIGKMQLNAYNTPGADSPAAAPSSILKTAPLPFWRRMLCCTHHTAPSVLTPVAITCGGTWRSCRSG